MDKLNKLPGDLHSPGNPGEERQGSVRKISRPGEILTAIKLFPFPVRAENPADKNFTLFQNRLAELERLKRAPHPHLVEFLSSGSTENGKSPFIEMELVEGPHLEELQHSRFEPVFPINEILKVADHLSAALAHWHQNGFIHGKVKSENVRLDVRSGNYILVNFGWPPFEPEAGAKTPGASGGEEGLAPEEAWGRVLVQTDIYHFGIIMFQLVLGHSFFGSEARAGTADRQTASYLGTPPHEFLTLRKKVIPLSWPKEKVQEETVLPEWFVLMIYKCLDKDPEARFENGMLLHRYILENRTKGPSVSNNSGGVEHDYEKLLAENLLLKESLEKEKHFYKILHGQWKALNDAAIKRESEPGEFKSRPQGASFAKRLKSVKISRKSLVYLVSGFAVLALFAGYFTFRPKEIAMEPSGVGPVLHSDTGKDESAVVQEENKTTAFNREKKDSPRIAIPKTTVVKDAVKTRNQEQQDVTDVSAEPAPDVLKGQDNLNTKYKVKSKAYFYNLPYEETRRNAFIIHWNNAVLSPLDEKNGFIYIVFTNHLGQTSRGWLRKKDLSRITQKG